MAGIGYAFISAYLKGEEARMVDSERLNAVMKASGFDEAVDAIRDTDIGNYLEGLDITTFDELDEQLWIYFSSCLERIDWFKSVPKQAKNIIHCYTARYDIQNIKIALQNVITGVKTKGLPAGTIHSIGMLEDLINADNLDDIQAIANACKLSDYANVLESYRTDDGIGRNVLTDTGLESLYYSKLIDSIKKSNDNEALLKAVYSIIDMTNLQIVLRAVINESVSEASGRTIEGGYILNDATLKELVTLKPSDIAQRLENSEYRAITEEILANYEKDGNISAIDEAIDMHKFRMISEILSPRIMSPVVIVWYLILKEIEIRNVRLVLKASLDNIPPEEIRGYLVHSS